MKEKLNNKKIIKNNKHMKEKLNNKKIITKMKDE